MESTDIVIIGGGVVGLAIAYSLSESYKNVFLLERHTSFGQESSSRNSEVIHAGIYYPKDFLKGRLCLEGNELMYDICKRNNILHINSGKLIVATNEDEAAKLPALLESAIHTGAKGVRLVSKREIGELEPKVFAIEALFCPSSGFVDSHRLMMFFEASSIMNGANIVYNVEVISLAKDKQYFIIGVREHDGNISHIKTKIVINSAGLESGNIAAMAGIIIDEAGYKINYHKGFYFRVTRNLEMYPSMLIYPVPPEPGSVGIHTTPDLAGGMRLGPHFIWSDTIDYTIDENWREYFWQSANKYLPFLEPEDLQPDIAGIMSTIQKPGEDMKDFIIKNEAERGLNGLINLIGIESPGLTASPAIGKMVKGIVDEILA